MEAFRCAVVLLVLACALGAKDDENPCSQEGATRLDGIVNGTCGSIEGRVQVCEGLQWKHLCDSNWTMEDATVTCRSQSYSAKRASNLHNIQSSDSTSSYEVVCTGSEENLAECRNTTRKARDEEDPTDCMVANFVMCFTTDENAELSSICFGPGSTPPSNATSSSISPETSTTTVTDANGFLTAPTLYYFIGGLFAIIVAVILLIVVFLLVCCFCCTRRKGVSPADAGQQKKGNGELQSVEYGTEPKTRDHMTAHHQLQQSQPIYEAIPSNENSSTHSHDSPSLKPLPTATSDLYSSLDQSNMYAQIEPHISSPLSATFSSPSSEAYQQLNHRTGSRTGSMKRELPSRPVEAMNPIALAMARGEVAERDLSTQGDVLVGGSSTSLPANTGYSNHHQQMLNGRPHLEEVRLKELLENGTEPGSTNIYHVLDPPPPDYSTLEQIDEISQVSNAAVCNNGTARGGQGSKGHSPHFSHHSQERFPTERSRSATLPGGGSHSSHSSRTSSLSSNSPQTNRTNRSPQVGRLGGPVSRKVNGGNKYSDDPTASVFGSPRISLANRHSGQSGGSDVNDASPRISLANRQSGGSDVIDTLV